MVGAYPPPSPQTPQNELTSRMMLRRFLLTGALVWAASILGCGSSMGYTIQVQEARLSGALDRSPHVIIIRNRADLDRVREKLKRYGFPELDETDLADSVLIAVVSGIKPSMRHELRITNVKISGRTGGIEIVISEDITTKYFGYSVDTHPYTIVSISSSHEAALSKGVRCIDSMGRLWTDKVYADW